VIEVASQTVVILSVAETVNAKIPSALEATALCKMADRVQITGGIVDGLLAFDNAPAIDSTAANDRTMVAHPGSGSSLCALQAGRSVAMTMAFSPLSGLVRGTRPGQLDVGLLM
jgi:Acetokinase family